MDRRKFIGLIGSGIAATNTASMLGLTHTESGASSMNPTESPTSRPNFIFIICDDTTFRTVHSINNPEIHTPNLDRIAASGCTFTHCFHQGSWSPAVCIPSRMMLNTGLTAFHVQTGVDDVPTWSQTLGNAGYDTYISGKWHLDVTALQRSFKEMGPVAPGMLVSTPIGGSAYFRPRPGDTWSPSNKSLKGHWLHTGLWVCEFRGC